MVQIFNSGKEKEKLCVLQREIRAQNVVFVESTLFFKMKKGKEVTHCDHPTPAKKQ